MVSMPDSAKAAPGADVAAVLIVRNESRCIARCLESVRPWVDRMLVLDTGSTDGTPDLARQCGAEVHHLAWPNDFSVARNHALELADAEWNLILDADEWIASGGETLRPWCAGPRRLGQACVHSAFDAGQGLPVGAPTPTSRSWITRLLPRGARFQGRVHEQVISPLPRERTGLHIGHDGYLDAQMEHKRERNEPLLLRDLQDNPEDPYIAFQLGKEAEGRDRFADACGRYALSLAHAPRNANWFQDLVVRYLHCLGQSGRNGEAMALAEEHMPGSLESPDFFFVLGNLALDRAIEEPAAAVEHWLPLAITAWERCLAIGERPDIEGSVEGRGSHLARHNLDIVQSQLAQLAG